MHKWYKLDNVGIFYSFTRNTKIPKVFRYSAILKDNIDSSILQEALNETLKTYPNFNVNLRKGFYWYYLDEASKPPRITKENLPICFKLSTNSDDYLYRVSYFNKKINLEISHILSDGKGSIEFFKHLITTYISLKYNLNIELNSMNSELEKTEDSFNKYYHKSHHFKKDNYAVYLYKGKKYHHETRFLECHLDLNAVLDLAHKYDTTLTIFLVSVLIMSFKDELKTADYSKHIRIDIPVDLRTYFKSSTLMNFFGLISISYKFTNKEASLEDIISHVTTQFKEKLDAEKLSERVNLMVSFERNWLCRILPIFIKEPVLNIIDKVTSNASTTCLSNIGKVTFDFEVSSYITSISALTSTNTFQFTICSFQNDLCIGLSNRFLNNDILKNFCRYFSHHNFNVTIDVSEVK